MAQPLLPHYNYGDVTNRIKVLDALIIPNVALSGYTTPEVGMVTVNPADDILYWYTGTVWAAPAGTGTVTNIATGTGLTGGPITTTGTISLANTAVTAGSYTAADITVDAQGRITAAASGSAGSGTVTSVGLTSSDITVGGTSPITTSGTFTLTLPTVNSNVGTFNNVTVTGKGLVTAASNVAYLTTIAGIAAGGDLTGTYVNPTIAANAVTYAKMQAASTTSRLVGSSASSTTLQELIIGSGLTLSGTTLTAAGTGGTVTSVSGTTDRITSTGGATPIIDIAATYVGQTSITTLGTITAGTWTGTKVSEVYGGTNQSVYLLGDTLYASAANTLSKLGGNTTTAKQFLSQTGTGAASAAPVWVSLTGTDITGAALTKLDDTNVTLTLGGSPTTALLNAASLTLGWTGTLSPARGGTGVANNASSTITISGNFGTTFSISGTTSLTLPVSGTLYGTQAGTITSAQLATSLTDETGTGASVFATSPTLVTPLLGTPTSGVLTNCTGLPLSTGVTGTLGAANGGTGVANNAASTLTISGNFGTTFSISGTTSLTLPVSGTLYGTAAGTITSAQLATSLTNETGSGSAVFGTDPSLTVSSPGTTTFGYLGIPQNSQSAAYTTVMSDAGKHIFHPAADTTARTFTIDSNANVPYPIGTTLTFINETLGGVITIAITSDTLLFAGAATTGSRTLAASNVATATKITSTKWIIVGSSGLT